MNISLILTLVALAFVVFRILWGFVRGLQKQRIRTIMILICAVVAVATTISCCNSIAANPSVNDTIITNSSALGESVSDVVSAFPADSPIYSALTGLSMAIVAPLVCVMVFICLGLVSWFIFLIIGLIGHRAMKRANENASAKAIRSMILSVVEALVVIGVWTVPVAYYIDLAPDAVQTIQSENIIEDQGTLDLLDTVSSDYIGAIHDNPIVVSFRTLGGQTLMDNMSAISFTANGEVVETNLKAEINSTLQLVGKVMNLKDFNMESLSGKDVDAIKGVVDSFADSKLLSTIVCEGLHSATDAWSKGNDFAGVSKPDLGGGEGDVAEMMDSLFDIINNDTKSVNLLKKDLYTVADFMDVIIKYGAMDAFSSGDAASLASIIGTTIDGDDILTAMNKVLAANDSFAPIYEKLNSIVDSVKAQAFEQIFGITGEEAEALVEKTEEIFGDVADTINSIDKSKPLEDQKAELSSALEDIIKTNAAEVDVTIEGLDIGAVSDSVAAEFLDNPDKYENVSQEDIKAYILQYASGQIQ